MHYDLAALDSQRVFDPDKDQTAMKLYTVDGTLITSAWGQDPATAGPGNPYLDVGTTVLPFPVPVLKKVSSLFTDNSPTGISTNDIILYTLTIENKGLLPLGNTLVIDSPSPNVVYVTNSTTFNATSLVDDTNGVTRFPLDESGYTIPIILRGGSSVFTYKFRIIGSGPVTNTAVGPGYGLVDDDGFDVPPPAGATNCNLRFTDNAGSTVSTYVSGGNLYVTLTDADANTNATSTQTVSVVVLNSTHGDVETITLRELSANTNIFRNASALPLSSASGISVEDGTLYTLAGDSLAVTHTDPIFGDVCSASASVAAPPAIKVLYLSTDGAGSPDQDLDRVDPVAAGDATTAQSGILSNGGGGGLGTTTTNATDNFASGSYAGGTGWSASWQEVGEADGTNAGLVRVTSQQLVLGKASGGNTSMSGIGISRAVNLSGASTGTLSFAVDTSVALQAAVDLQASTNGSTWTTLWSATTNTGTVTVGLESFLGTNTQIRWVGTGSLGGGDRRMFIDDIVITSSAGFLPIGVDASSKTNSTAAANVLNIRHTTGTGQNRLMLVGVGMGVSGGLGAGNTVTNIYCGTQALTRLSFINEAANLRSRSEVWYLLNPPSTTTNIFIGLNATVNIAAGVTTFSNANQTTTFGTVVTNQNTSTTISVINTGIATNELIYNMANSDDSPTMTAGSGQTMLWVTNSATETRSAASTKTGLGTITNTWTLSASQEWTSIGVPIKAITNSTASSSGTNTAVFTQTPSFCSAFTLSAGGTVTITNYVTVTSGSMPTNAAVAARLTYGTNAIVTITNATYNSGSGTLTWSSTLGGAVTVPSGQAIALTVSNYESSVAFRVEFDSTNKPSKIQLPTTNVIDITSLGVYDAPYPGGSLVSSPAAGAVLYVRTIVTDPFGSYDITSLGLSIDGPVASGDTNATLTASSVVASNACTKTYEFQWRTINNQGAYDIAVAAHEGTEGITDTEATQVTLTFLDTGTPSITEFTIGNNGTNADIYATNQTVCMRVTDLDQNLNTNVAETVVATVVSSSGDSETLTFTETGPNTGVFTTCVTASATTGGTPNNGTLLAPAGAVLVVTYTDPDDPSDISDDTATVPTPPGVPALAVSKVLTVPSDGQAQVGDAVSFDIFVVNSGSTTQSVVFLTDLFQTNQLTFVSASPTQSSNTPPGRITWNNIGPMTPGQSTNLTVNFIANGTATPSTNTATASGGGVTNSSSDTVVLTRPLHTVTKTLVSPAAGPVGVGSNVVFRIVVQNTGSTVITNLPLEDTYSSAYFTFVSATIAPDSAGAGSLLWNDLTGAGSLAVGASITNNLSFTVIGAGNPANNLATAGYSVDIFGDPVPPASSSTGIVTLAAAISGTVFNDSDTNNTFSGPDTGLGNVTVHLYTDPNGDGDPADGVLVAVTATSTNGTYEFLNLATGRYTVVEFDLVGYSSIADTGGTNDNRIAVNTTTLTTFGGNNFLDQLITTANYAPISGQVRLDADGDGDLLDVDAGVSNVTIEVYTDPNGDGDASDGALIITTTTGTNGTYSTGPLPPGNYVVIETDPAMRTSTGDRDGNFNANGFNAIGVTLTSSGSTANDFLDATLNLESFRSNYTTVTNLYYRDPDLSGNTQDVIYVGGRTYEASTNYDVAYYDRDGRLVHVDTTAFTGTNGFLFSTNPNTNANVTYGTWTAITLPDGVSPQATLAAQITNSSTITTDNFDVVSWSTTTFTDSTGTPTSVYGSSNGTGVVYLQTIDRDQNQNTNAIETITVTLTNAATGDSETVTLYETGANTGVFANNSGGQRLAFPISNSGPATANNGTLRFDIGDALNVRYTDPNDPADQSGSVATTQVLLSGFRARWRGDGGDGVLLEWATASEYDTAGFYVEREADGVMTRVNDDLLAALPPAPGGAGYALLDRGAAEAKELRYWLVEAEMRGGVNRHGPFGVEGNLAPAAAKSSAGLGDAGIARTIDQRPLRQAQARRLAAARANAQSGAFVSKAAPPANAPLKIELEMSGAYGLTRAQIAAAAGISESALGKQIKNGKLRVREGGRDVAWTEINDRIVFLGAAAQSRYTTTNVYWMEQGNATRIADRNSLMGATTPGISYPETRTYEQNHYAPVSLMVDASRNIWFWDYIQAGSPTAGRKSFAFNVDALAPTAEPASLTVRLMGGTKTQANPEHHIRIAVNGQTVGEASWDGTTEHTLTASFAQALLQEGTNNTLEITGLLEAGVPFSIVYLNNFDVTYRRQYRAVNGALTCLPAGNAMITVDGFVGPDILVYEAGDWNRPVHILGTRTEGAAGNYRISFRTKAGDQRYYVFEGAAIAAPASVGSCPLPDLKSAANRANYLMIAPDMLSDAAAGLVATRAGQGLVTKQVRLEDVYNVFNFGRPDPEAIRSLLRASRSWGLAPTYCVLAGAGTYDYKNFLGYGECLVPPLLVSTPVGVLPSDSCLGDVGGDATPEVAVGRLPVISAAELLELTAKIAQYEQAVSGTAPALMAADNGERAGNFPADSHALGALQAVAGPVQYLDLVPGQTTAFRTALFTQLHDGRRLMNWTGHGGISALANEGVLKTTDMPALNNATQPTVVIGLSCLLGHFAIPGVDTLGEVLVSDTNGAAAVWAPSGLAYNQESMLYGRGFHTSVGAGGAARLGDAVLAAHAYYAQVGRVAHMPLLYNLLGDPATSLRGPIVVAAGKGSAGLLGTDVSGIDSDGPASDIVTEKQPTGPALGHDTAYFATYSAGTADADGGDVIELQFRRAPSAEVPAYAVDLSTNLPDNAWLDISEQILSLAREPLSDGGELVTLRVRVAPGQGAGFLRVRATGSTGSGN